MPLHAGYLNLSTSKVKIGGDTIQVSQAGLADQLFHGGLADHGGVETSLRADLQSQRAGGVSLRIKIQNKDGMPRLRNGGRQIHRGRGFPNAPLLVGNGNDFCLHGIVMLPLLCLPSVVIGKPSRNGIRIFPINTG